MEETGIIRRLDALGRIVIPREFRKLNRIDVGDPIEMRALSGGEIMLRKVDMASQLKSAASMTLATLGEKTDKLIGVCSTDEWLLFTSRSPFTSDELPEILKVAIMDRKPSVVELSGYFAAVYPVYGDTGIFGAYVLFSDSDPSDVEHALLETVAVITGKTIQNF